METGIVSDTKYNETRKMEIRTSIFATSNNLEKIIEPLVSRFFIVRLRAYTYEQFYEITLKLLTSQHHNVDEEITSAIIEAVLNNSKNIRESIRVARIAKSVEDVDWLITTFLKDNESDQVVPSK